MKMITYWIGQLHLQFWWQYTLFIILNRIWKDSYPDLQLPRHSDEVRRRMEGATLRTGNHREGQKGRQHVLALREHPSGWQGVIHGQCPHSLSRNRCADCWRPGLWAVRKDEMKVTGISSGFSQKRGQGKQAYVNVFLEAESTAERAMMAMATAGILSQCPVRDRTSRGFSALL